MLELRKHQLEHVERARSLKHMAIFADAGTGKTGTMVRILCEEYNRSKRIVPTLIFAPLSVCEQWPGEFTKFSKMEAERILVLTGAGKKRVEQLEHRMHMRSDQGFVVLTNYEALQIKDFYRALLAWSPEVIVCDESHRIKDSQSKRAKLLYPLSAMCKRRFILTGTPVLNSLQDIFGQYKFLDPNVFGPGFWSFRQKYFYNKNAGRQFAFPEWLPTVSASEEIGRKIAATSVQVKLAECLDLPELQQISVPCTMGTAQAKAFKEMKKNFLTEVNGQLATAEFAMTKAMKMLQVACGFIRPDDSEEPVWFDDVPRLDALADTLDSIGTEKVIIWTTYQPSYEKIAKLCLKQGKTHTFLTGEQSAKQKSEAIAEFTGGSCQVLISNPAAGGVGLNLQCARYAIYYNRGYSLEQWLQSQARNYRSGSERHTSIVHYILHCPGTLDAVVGGALDGKEDVAEAVLRWAKEGACT